MSETIFPSLIYSYFFIFQSWNLKPQRVYSLYIVPSHPIILFRKLNIISLPHTQNPWEKKVVKEKAKTPQNSLILKFHSSSNLKIMEKSSSSSSSSSSPKGTAEGGLLSCWSCLKVKLPWAKRGSTYKPIGGFKYDPLSYAQNFDEGWVDDDDVCTRRGFSARYAAPSTDNKTPAFK